MKYILIFWFSASGAGGMTTAEFNSAEACYHAQEIIDDTMKKRIRGPAAIRKTVCVPKGEQRDYDDSTNQQSD